MDRSSYRSIDDFVRLAKCYLLRRAASTSQLRGYLARKATRVASGTVNDEFSASQVEAHIDEAVARAGRAGLLNDDTLARSRGAALVRKGLPARRVARVLAGQGLVAAAALDGEGFKPDDEMQAIRYAERKRLGAFASGRRTPSFARDVRALVRAGFNPSLALKVMRQLTPPMDDRPNGHQ